VGVGQLEEKSNGDFTAVNMARTAFGAEYRLNAFTMLSMTDENRLWTGEKISL